jgi:alanine-glyoxylate transaminase/serine-glyoxylate transaminase/serine-pyruvate transaminase
MDLKKVFKTKQGQTFIFPSSGTGAWEAALTNTMSPGDVILASRFGQFSHLWIDMAQRLGFEVEVLDVEWGEGVPLERIEEVLRADTAYRIKGILACHNETTTGVTSDLAGLRRVMDATHHPALLFADAVSSLASIDFRMDEWGVDLAVSGSQKGLMLPAGLGILAVSRKALDATRSASSRRCYFDLAEGVRAAVIEGWGLQLCAKEPRWYSDTVSAVMLPEGINGAHIIDVAFRRYNLALGAGLSQVAGKLFRIGHLGDLNEVMLMGAIAGAEMAMLDVGVSVTPGSGVAAASNYWRSHDPVPKRRASKEEQFYEAHSTGSIQG